jgi:redox-sensitive bicupin YhaK (pirin superfamily)
METTAATVEREAILVEDAHVRPMMGLEVLEPVPARNVPYELSDPFILVHEATVPINAERAKLDTTHPHRGFDNLWYILSGDASTGHSTGPGGTFERAQLGTGGLLKIRTGRGVYHAESIGADQLAEGRTGEFRSVLFWVNLARKDKASEPTAQVVAPDELPSRTEGGVTVRILVGPGSPVELGTPGLILDVELPEGGSFDTPIPEGFNAFVWMLEGEASVGASRRSARRSQIAVLGPEGGLSVANAVPGTRFMLMAGMPYGEDPIYNGPYVD